ncbi:MAG: hypothetical protein AB1646_10165 [Thermodesulfobacteriota bacterium]
MRQVLADLYSIIRLREQEARSELKATSQIPDDTLSLLQSLVICESMVLDALHAPEWRVPSFCARFENVFEFSDLGDLWDECRLPQDRHGLGDPSGDRFLLAALTYLRVAQARGFYLLVHPTRFDFLNRLALPIRIPAAEIAIEELERQMANSEALRYAAIDFSVPPVAEQVLLLHRMHGLDIAAAVNELRDSPHARSFRRYCGHLDDELLNLTPRASLCSLQRLVRDVRKAADQWKGDLDEGVRHVTRRLSLRKIWGLGPILEALDLDKVTFRDPVVLAPCKAHLLFLNDLYRAPQRRPASNPELPTLGQVPRG